MLLSPRTLTATFSLLALWTSHAAAAKRAADDSQIHWGPCDLSVTNDTTLSCGFLTVPLDYGDPSAGEAQVAVAKANATGERLGSVFMNPGGPGDSGITELAALKDLLYNFTGGVYDLISWDPRGVGLTTPGQIYCFDSVEEYDTFFNGTVELTGIEQTGNFTDQNEINALLAQAPAMQQKYEEVGLKCMKSSNGKYLKYIGTAAVVRDMVSIANVLDGSDAPINYIGFSYGTIIASWFINMFPERVGRVIINGVLPPVPFATEEIATHWSQQLDSADAVYQGLITGCALAGPSGCALASQNDTAVDVDAKIQDLMSTAYNATLQNSSVPYTSGNIRSVLYALMYAPQYWSLYANQVYPEAVAAVQCELQPTACSNQTNQRRDMIPRAPLVRRASNDTRSYSEQAIYCGDSVDPQGTTVEEVFQAVIAQTHHVSHIAGTVWPDLPCQCSSWPVRAVERYQGPFNKTLANKVLIASSKYDPITPLSGAQTLAGILGDNAALMYTNGFGHSTIQEPSQCATQVFMAYMVNNTLPANNTVCEVDTDFEIFPGVTTADILGNMTTTGGAPASNSTSASVQSRKDFARVISRPTRPLLAASRSKFV